MGKGIENIDPFPCVLILIYLYIFVSVSIGGIGWPEDSFSYTNIINNQAKPNRKITIS